MQYLRRKMSSELINQSIIREHLTSSEVMEKEDEIKENWCSKDCAGPLFAEKNDPNFSFEHLSSQSPMYQDLQSSVVCKYDTSPKNWEDLDISLRNLLPNEEGITYVITSYESCSKEFFSGAPANTFESTERVNLIKEDGAKRWLESMMKHSKCTYRQSKGRRPGGKRVIFKVKMHCQHKRKPLTPRQIKQKASVSAGNSNKWLMHGLRQKNTLYRFLQRKIRVLH